MGNLTDLAMTAYRGGNTALSHRRLVYDAFGRLVRVAAVEGMDETDVALYRYNGLNMRLMWQDDADADSTLESSERFYVMHDERWRPVATFRDTDSTPKEAFVWHAAGGAGQGGFGAASYIDSIILRDRDNFTGGTPNPMTSASDGTLEERRYYCQNWRADVVAVTKSDGTPIEYVRYSAYGEPTVYPVADLNMDGVVNSTDSGLWSDLLYSSSNSSVYADTDLDWDGADDWNSSGIDSDLFYESYNANTGLSGVGRVSSAGVGNRTGYAGYQWDGTMSAYHVRYRVYLPDIGRWTRRDPLGYVDGESLYEYVASQAVAGRDPIGLDSELVGPPHPCEVAAELYNINQLLEAVMLDTCGFDQDLQLWWDAGRFTGGTSLVLFEIAAAQVEKGAREAAFRAAKYKARGRRRGDWGLFLSNHYEEVGARRLKRAAKCVPIAGDAFTIVDGVCAHDYGQVQQGVCSHLLDYFGSWGRAAGLIGDVGTLLIDARTDWVQRKSVGDQRASACAFLKSVWQARQQSLHQAWADCWSTVFRWPWSR